MTWPTTPVSTQYLDEGTDEPRLARANIKSAVDNVNSIAAEFGNVAISSSANYQVLQHNGTVYRNTYPEMARYTEPISNVSPTTGNITINCAAGNNFMLTPTGACSVTFANLAAGSTATLWIHWNTGYNVAVNSVKWSGGFATLSNSSSSTDAVIVTRLGASFDDYYFASLVKGFV